MAGVSLPCGALLTLVTVNVKLFGLTGSMVLFLMAQIYWLYRRGKLAL